MFIYSIYIKIENTKRSDEYKQALIIIIHPYVYIHTRIFIQVHVTICINSMIILFSFNTCIFIQVHVTICINIMVILLSFNQLKYLISIWPQDSVHHKHFIIIYSLEFSNLVNII